MPLHDVEMAEQVLREGRAAVVAEESGEALHRLDIVGQGMGLLVRHHLQPVFDPPQKFIGRGQLVARLEGDPVARRQHVQRFQRRPHPQFGMPAAGDQLLGLREKLDFADAAAADLDIVALDRDLALAAKGLHLPLHVVHVGKGREIQMLAPDEGRDFRNQRLAGLGVAGAGPRLDHGGAFPGPPFPLVIMQRRFGRDRHLRRGRIRPQPQIDAEHVAVAGALLQQPRQRLRDAHEKRLRLDIRRQRRRGGIEKHDQVDVAGIIQFARAHLAHGEHDQTAIVLGAIEVWLATAGLARLPGAAESAAPIAPRRPQGRSAPPSPASPARPRRCRTARSAARLPISCGGAVASHRLRSMQPTRRGRSFRSVGPDRPPVRIRAAGSGARRRRGRDRKDRARLPRCPTEWFWRAGNRAMRSSIAAACSGCEIGQPVCQSLLGFIGSGHMRSVHEPRGQTMLVRVALRG